MSRFEVGWVGRDGFSGSSSSLACHLFSSPYLHTFIHSSIHSSACVGASAAFSSLFTYIHTKHNPYIQHE